MTDDKLRMMPPPKPRQSDAHDLHDPDAIVMLGKLADATAKLRRTVGDVATVALDTKLQVQQLGEQVKDLSDLLHAERVSRRDDDVRIWQKLTSARPPKSSPTSDPPLRLEVRTGRLLKVAIPALVALLAALVQYCTGGPF